MVLPEVALILIDRQGCRGMPREEVDHAVPLVGPERYFSHVVIVAPPTREVAAYTGTHTLRDVTNGEPICRILCFRSA